MTTGSAGSDVHPSHRFSSAELRDPLRATKRLLLAAQDMDDAHAAAYRLLEGRVPERPLETAVAVCYARPWTSSNRIGALGARWLPSDATARALHEHLLRLRAKLYAHTDEEFGARGIRDVGSMLGEGRPTFAVEWRPFNRDLLPAIIDLTERQQQRFKSAARELERSVDRYVVRVVWPLTAVAQPERVVLLDELEAELFALNPHAERRQVDDRGVVVELEQRLADGQPLADFPTYGILRVLRAARQWWRQLRFPDITLYLAVGSHTYVLHADSPAQFNARAIATDRASAPPGFRVWDPSTGSWVAASGEH